MRVDVVKLVRHFGSTKAVDDITFGFESGQIFGFVGPNGAGKTTTMRILATLDEPTEGDARIDGVSVVDEPERARRLVGYVPDNLPTHRDMSVHEYLDFFCRAYGLKGARRTTVIDEIESFCNLQGIKQKMLRALSKGMKQRVSLARALVHDPPLLIMDEPAAGLDPRARIELRELLLALASRGKAILISSHILTELSEICHGAVIIERGRLLRAGTIDHILEHGPSAGGNGQDGDATPTLTNRLMIVRPFDRLDELYKAVLEMPRVEAAAIVRNEVEVEFAGDAAQCCDLLAELIHKGFRIAEFRQQKADLERVFMNITRGDVQ
jgi:ABC-2 type transport system ATP-binding protein